MKKVKILAVVALLGLLTACGSPASKGKTKSGSDKTENVSKSKAAEVKLEEGFFVEPIGGDNDDDQEFIALTLKVKNTSKDSIHVWDESFYLTEKDDDEKISAMRDYESDMGDFMGQIANGKSLTGTIIFEVDSKKDYVLNFTTNGLDEDGKAAKGIELDLDLSKYEDSKKEMDEAATALQAYIDVVLLQKDNDDYEKLVANDSEKEIAAVEKEYTNHIKDTFYKFRPSEDQFQDGFESYVANQKEAIETELTVVGYVGHLAKVEVAYTGISDRGVRDLLKEYKDEYFDTHDDYDSEKSEEFAFSKLEDIYSEADTGEPRDEIYVNLTKKDDKWSIDFKSDDSYENQKLIKAYLGDVD